ncbi:exo-alpha-sialidase [candidate division KSB1 bacterium]|nr:exo-alpha-sialidase [candidate division KSB1 bacterium]
MVCECCPTSVAVTGNGTVVAVYRDRSDTELRNTGVVRYHNGSWSSPRIIHNDNWEIAGCPVNGPAIAVQGGKVAVAWFTWANEIARVKVTFSNDEGRTFGDPIVVDDGDPVGRVDTVILPSGSVLVSWMESTGTNAELRVRRVHWDCTKDQSITVTKASKERATGMPKMAIRGNEIFFAWTQTGKPSHVKTAIARIN